MTLRFLCVPIVFVATLAGCTREQSATAQAAAQSAPPMAQPAPLPMPAPARYLRDRYVRLDDCVHDWARADKCVATAPTTSRQSDPVAFLGPAYSSAIRSETQLALRREAFEQGYTPVLDEVPSDLSVGRSELRPQP